MSLTTCLKKMGKNVSAEDRAAIQAAAAEFRAAGMKPDDAARAAVAAQMASLEIEAANVRNTPPPEVKAEAAEPAKPAGAATPEQSIARQADEIAQVDPDMMVMMEGMEQPVKVSELLEEAKAMLQQEMADAPLLQVAAECALRG